METKKDDKKMGSKNFTSHQEKNDSESDMLGLSEAKTNEQESNKEEAHFQKELCEKDKKIEELTDTLKRLQAEFENFKKRCEKDRIEFAKYAQAGIINDILPVVDSFELALKHSGEKEKFVEGTKMIFAQLYSILESAGVKPIKSAGEKFDPYRHEVLIKEASDKPEGTVLEEFQKGYMLNEKVLRFSKVKISGK